MPRHYEENDNVMTPRPIAKMVIDWYDLSGKVLEPFRGAGAFYDQLPDTVEKDWCEISEGKDFFQYIDHVDWVVTNPPYSKFDEVLDHCMEVADNIVFLIPVGKIFLAMNRIRRIYTWGGIVNMHVMPAKMCEFPFGFPVAAMYLKKGYKSDSIGFDITDIKK